MNRDPVARSFFFALVEWIDLSHARDAAVAGPQVGTAVSYGHPWPDWRNAAAYQPLLRVERSALAWEWLRRQPKFQAAALDAIESRRCSNCEEQGALAWNLHAFEDPRVPAPLARPVWASAACKWVVKAFARPCLPGEDCIDFERLQGFRTIVRSRRAERLLLSDGYQSIRIDVHGARLGQAPVLLTFQLQGNARLDRSLIVLQRLRALSLNGCFRSPTSPQFQRAGRIVLLLRAFDALRAGASQADIAATLLRSDLELRRWRTHSSSVRSQAQRLSREAKRMAADRFWQLLS